jgi:hypothetical protein
MANVGFWQQDQQGGYGDLCETLQFYGCPSGLPESAHAFDFGSHLLLKHVATIGYTMIHRI